MSVPDNAKRDKFVSNVLNKMTLAEKVGQCFTLSWRGSIITPSVMDVIEKLHVGGLRIEPYTTESATAGYYGRRLSDPNFSPPEDYFTIAQTYFKAKLPGTYVHPDEYAARLNKLKDIAGGRPCGVPLHIALDYEGDYSHDYPFGGMHMFPSQMALSACDDPDLVYRVGNALAKQLHAVGITMVHSPVCGINVNPANPEIGVRSFGDDAQQCAANAARLYEGIRDGGLVATAKHFPGRGASSTDAHHELECIEVDRETMMKREIVPFKRLIDMGLGAIMSAHSAYPAFDAPDIPATLSRKLMHGLLREQLGFTGVITTDAMGMGAIVNRWGIPRACVMALKAGCNLLLVKNDEEVRTQAFFEVKKAMENGEITEEELEESVRCVLVMKYDQGLFDTGGKVEASSAPVVIAGKELSRACRESCAKSLIVMRDTAALLPLSPRKTVLVIEQMIPSEFIPNDTHCNPHVLNEAMIERSRNVINATTEFCATEKETALMLDVAQEADIVVATNFYWRIRPRNNTELIGKLIAAGKQVVVLTNVPYAMGCPPQATTVICGFGAVPNSLRAAAALLYGRLRAQGVWPLRHFQQPAT